MQSHQDKDWNDSLQRTAAAIKELGLSGLTSGYPSEPVLANWVHEAVDVTKRPDDEHGIDRVSIGGSEELGSTYCVFRGDILRCRALLQQAIKALDVRCPVMNFKVTTQVNMIIKPTTCYMCDAIATDGIEQTFWMGAFRKCVLWSLCEHHYTEVLSKLEIVYEF